MVSEYSLASWLLGEEVAFCPKDFPFLAEGDIMEVYLEDEYPRLLLKVVKGSLRDEFWHRGKVEISLQI